MSVKAFIQYLDLEKNYSKHTCEAYKRDIRAFEIFYDRNQEGDFNQTDYHLIRKWIGQLVEDGHSNRTINRKIASLKAYFKFLLIIGEIAANPLQRHRSLKTAKKVGIPYSEDEMGRLLDDIEFPDDFEGVRDKAIIHLLYGTGIRRAELMGLQLHDVELSNQRMKVLGKRNKERIVPLMKPLVSHLEQYLLKREGRLINTENNYFFTTKTGGKLYGSLVYGVINKYLGYVTPKVKRSPHVLRHTFATHLLNNGADLNAVKELLGHSSLASTQVYVHSNMAKLKKAHKAAHPRSKEP